MATEGFQPGDKPLETPGALYLTDAEREALAFYENNLAISGLTKEAQVKAAKRKETLEAWRDRGIAVPIRAWALKYVDMTTVEPGAMPEPKLYNDDEPHEEKGGWTPPDRYVILSVHDTPIEGVMAWIQPAIDRDRRYEVIGRVIEFVTDADIQKYWGSIG